MCDEYGAVEEYFAATNSGVGFVNYFDEIFGAEDRVYILKGGPGTGKSYFLRKIQKMCIEKGIDCECYLCSSDPDSLDGIRIPGLSVSVFDGTSPHAADVKLPGARENLINLGAFWREDLLRAHREEIECRAEKKADAYRGALYSMGLAQRCMAYRMHILAPYVRTEKMEKASDRLLRRVATKKGSAIPRPIRSYGMKGQRSLDTLSRMAKIEHFLPPLYGVELMYLKTVLEKASKRGLEVIYSPHPIDPLYPEALYFKESGVLLSVGKGSKGKTVGLRRFLDSDVFVAKGKLMRYLVRTEGILIKEATEEFAKMREHHFVLERIYENTMDFGAKEEYTNRFLEALFDKEKNDKIF